MTREGVNQIMLSIFTRAGKATRWDYDEGIVANLLIDELARNWEVLPDTTKATMLGVAYNLKLQSMELETAGEVAALAINRVMQASRVTR
ncbi:MAG: hypothetical protein HYX42_03490 [Polaromonas sp.]|uniref:hypothetical protein n=1 Tax=Polaromonas sp. TaxID=1869339 RepID=UPI0025E5CBC6|nr:hypothetical protein [Polaromonas sp.]MBI2725293.1 hypothetical protein [Polaromonas sp.]